MRSVFKLNKPFVHTAEEEAALREAYQNARGILKHEYDEEFIKKRELEMEESIKRIVAGLSTPEQEVDNFFREYKAKCESLESENK